MFCCSGMLERRLGSPLVSCSDVPTYDGTNLTVGCYFMYNYEERVLQKSTIGDATIYIAMLGMLSIYLYIKNKFYVELKATLKRPHCRFQRTRSDLARFPFADRFPVTGH